MKKILLLSVFVSTWALSYGQDTSDPQYDEWEFTIAPYLFMASINGDAAVAVDGRNEVDLNFGDILKRLQSAFMMRGEVYKGNWGIMADYIYLKIGDDIDVTENGVDALEFRQSIFEGFISRRIDQNWGWVDVYGGIRSWDFGLDLDVADSDITRVTFKQNWVDPVIGGRAVLTFSDRVSGVVRGDIGGFGLGSDFSFTVQAGAAYHFTDWLAATLHYKYLYVDYNNDKAAPDLFIYDAGTHGPLLGLVFQF